MWVPFQPVDAITSYDKGSRNIIRIIQGINYSKKWDRRGLYLLWLEIVSIATLDGLEKILSAMHFEYNIWPRDVF